MDSDKYSDMPFLRPKGLRGDVYNSSSEAAASGDPVRLVEGVRIEDLVPIITAHVKRDYQHDCSDANSWRNLPEFPTATEILPSSIEHCSLDLPINDVQSSWDDKEKYISTHYKLLRQDGYTPLRNAVMHFREHPQMSDDRDLCVYTQVHIVGYTFSNLGPAPCIEFSYARSGRKVLWNQSKRLQQGTLVALSPANDNFKTICKIAVVAARPLSRVEQNPPQIDLFWGSVDDAELDPSEEFVMIEARSGYFEANRHMLVAMQKLMTETFPLTVPLIQSSALLDTPDFLLKQPLMNLNSLLPEEVCINCEIPATVNHTDSLDNVNVLKAWPAIPGSDLDESQSAALKQILTKKVSIIQGPPGTGKTFVSICALRIMLDNWVDGDPPIIIAAQTNHALDQLLLLLSTHEPNFVRLGGRTDKDNEMIKSRTLFEIRSRAPQGSQPSRQSYKNARKALDDQTRILQEDVAIALMQGSGEVDNFVKLSLITEDQAESLRDEDWVQGGNNGHAGFHGPIPEWLGDQLTIPASCSKINLSTLEDEVDLEFEELSEKEAEERKAFDDDDIEALKGVRITFKEAYVGRPSTSPACTKLKIVQMLANLSDLYQIPPKYRGEVYRYLRRESKRSALRSFRLHMEDYDRAVKSLKISRLITDAYMIKRLGLKLIGCTTTGLSKYRGLLAVLKPQTLLIEEAAETTEGTVLAGMIESIQQLILVGDHQQLQATCNMQYLSLPPYNLAISMFERMVNNGVPFVMLNRQRRMIPELRKLLSQFYPQLKDHPSVQDRIVNRPRVPGMGGRDCYFFHHNWSETKHESSSRSNLGEADMIIGFYNYLIDNGLKPDQITILTFYNGQRKVLLNLLKKHQRLRDYNTSFKVFTVDSYQGEENDVVLLSLVRNNDEANIGFLENKNRAVVSLSRARRGFYLFGNALNLLQATGQSWHVWGTVTDELRKIGRPWALDRLVGLPLICEVHGNQTVITDIFDWAGINGGCTEKCGGDLDCGHPCPYKCHPSPHDEILCVAPCDRQLSCGHGCSGRCGDSCSCEICSALLAQPSQTRGIFEDGHQIFDQNYEIGPIRSNQHTRFPTRSNSTSPSKSLRESSPISSKSNTSAKWRNWSAADSDAALVEKRHADASFDGTASSQLQTIVETYRSTDFDSNSARRERIVPVAIRTITAASPNVASNAKLGEKKKTAATSSSTCRVVSSVLTNGASQSAGDFVPVIETASGHSTTSHVIPIHKERVVNRYPPKFAASQTRSAHFSPRKSISGSFTGNRSSPQMHGNIGPSNHAFSTAISLQGRGIPGPAQTGRRIPLSASNSTEIDTVANTTPKFSRQSSQVTTNTLPHVDSLLYPKSDLVPLLRQPLNTVDSLIDLRESTTTMTPAQPINNTFVDDLIVFD